ncbi:MAG: hypothetical protein EBZ77_05530 [Chitinophagia bacterium]|nr:hypothetical protein [Chitinophagia bacterium]
MRQDELISFMKQKMREIYLHGERIGTDFSVEDIDKFKKGFRFIRSWMEFVRLNSGDGGFRMSDKCKKIYTIAGVLMEAHAALNTPQEHATDLKKWNDLLDTAKKEWKKSYNINLLNKLEKQIVEFNYNRVSGELSENFLNRHKEADTNANS